MRTVPGAVINLAHWPVLQRRMLGHRWLPDVVIRQIYLAWLAERVELAKLEERVNG